MPDNILLHSIADWNVVFIDRKIDIACVPLSHQHGTQNLFRQRNQQNTLIVIYIGKYAEIPVKRNVVLFR